MSNFKPHFKLCSYRKLFHCVYDKLRKKFTISTSTTKNVTNLFLVDMCIVSCVNSE